MEINVVIERKDGSTFNQLVEVKKGQTINQALNECKKLLGKGYYVCTWWEVNKNV